MTPRQRKIFQEISGMDHPGNVLETLAYEAGLLNPADFIMALDYHGLLTRDHTPKAETVKNWFESTTSPIYLETILKLFRKLDIIPDKRNSDVEKHLKLLYYGSRRLRERREGIGLEPTIERLVELDKRLGPHTGRLLTNSAELDAYVERSELIKRLDGYIEETDDPLYTAQLFGKLFRMSHWNNRGLVEVKAEYFDLAEKLFQRLDEFSDKAALTFAVGYAELAYLAGDWTNTHGVINRTVPLILESDTTHARHAATGIIEIALAETDHTPGDFDHVLEQSGDRQAVSLARAAAERCKACRILDTGRLEDADRHIEQAEHHLGDVRAPSAKARQVRLYIRVLKIISEWRRHREPTPDIQNRVSRLIDEIRQQLSHDTPLLASLLMIRLEIEQGRSGKTLDDPPVSIEALSMAWTINDLVETSVPGYCLFRMDKMKTSATRMLSRTYRW